MAQSSGEHGSIVIPVKAHFRGGEFDNNRSELYDGVVALDGFSKILHLVAHAYINEEVILKSTALKGAKIFRVAPKQGSFFDVVNVVIENPYTTISAGVITNAFYDLLKHCCKRVVGQIVEPETPRIRKMVKRKEPTISRLCVNLREPVKKLHRPIMVNSSVTINIEQARKPLFQYNKGTWDVINSEEFGDMEYGLTCNVTKLNVNSNYGRIYLDEIGRTAPYETTDAVSFAEKQILSRSLDDTQHKTEKKIKIDAKKLMDSEGKVIKLYIYHVYIGNSTGEGEDEDLSDL